MSTTGDGRNVVTIYSRLAFVYDVWTWITERKSILVALSRAVIRDGEAVLEVAVGTGVVFREVLLRNPSGRNVGIDLTEAMLRRARRKAERTGVPFALERQDARALSFDDRTFDLVLSSNMFGLLPRGDVGLVLGEMLRVLRPGGRLVLVTMTCPSGQLPGWIYRLGPIRLGGWSDIQLESHVRAAGFEFDGREVVEQIGIPSEIVMAHKPSSP